MRPSTAQTLLQRILFLTGTFALVAVVPMVMPTEWMEAINDRLGLGPFQRSPLMEYLTRSLSALYALLGALAVSVARDVGRHLDLLVVVGWLTVLLGLSLTVIDLRAGMPASWTWGEGPPTVTLGLLIGWLARQARR